MCDELSSMFAGFTEVPYSKEEEKRISDKEDLERKNRKLKLLNTAITDQLWRPVLSDPTQSKIKKSSSSAQQSSSSSSQEHHHHHPHQMGDKRVPPRYLHDTLVKTSNSATECSLSNVIVFEARIISTMNKESLKDIMGFYFAIDGSITIYEYKQFGRESKILPLIKRNTYTHMRGPRKGENYVITDIIQGNDLEFPTQKQPLPDVWKNQDKLIVNIMSVDIEAKRNILLKNIDKYQHENVWNKLHMPKTDAEERYIRIPFQVKENTRQQLSHKPITTYLNIGNYYRRVCQSEKSTEKVNVYELEAGLAKFGITLSDNKLSGILEILDPDSTSFVNYLSFMRYVLGEMESERKCLVLKAFLKMDSTRNGIISTSLIHKFLNALKHAKVKTKEKSDEEIKKTFENAFKDSSNLATPPKTTITYREFEELFEGLSLKIASKVEFSNILKNMWSV